MSDLIITELKGSETASRLAQSFYEIHNNSAVGKYCTTQCLKVIQKSLILQHFMTIIQISKSTN